MAKGTIALGQFRGKVGGQVLRVVKGTQVIQNYQPVVANPATLPQVLQRAAIRTLGGLAKSLKAVLRNTYGGTYATGAFIKRNISRTAGVLNIADPSDVEVRYNVMKITSGSAGSLLYVEADGNNVDWGESTHLQVAIPISQIMVDTSIDEDNVRVYAALYCPALNAAVMSSGVTVTAAQSSGVYIYAPAAWDGQNVHAWLYLVASEGEIDIDAFDQTTLREPFAISEGSYVGSGEIM